MQHAAGSTPDPDHGYCVDDVARALQVDLLHARQLGWRPSRSSAARISRSCGGLRRATGRFRNFRRAMAPGSTRPHPRTARAVPSMRWGMRSRPRRMRPSSPRQPRCSSGRCLRPARSAPCGPSSVVLGCEAAIRGGSGVSRADPSLGWRTGSGLHSSRPRVRMAVAGARVTYENGLPSRALIVAGRHRADARMVQAGIRALEWLIAAQTAPTATSPRSAMAGGRGRRPLPVRPATHRGHHPHARRRGRVAGYRRRPLPHGDVSGLWLVPGPE